MQRDNVRSFISGVLCANSLPHLATAAAGHQHMSPLGGRTSGRWANLVWGAANLAGGLALVSRPPGRGRRWGPRYRAFGYGVAAFSLWSAVAENIFAMNVDP
ncbi:hypothetical protein ACO0LV_03380 [Pseudactinotalea sp. Z1739]|uniref:hypothetical protein n=1 Tax=Pseudactinotalea sp. Z1739 TaxID=3413028 RepID=UPI003C7A1A17